MKMRSAAKWGVVVTFGIGLCLAAEVLYLDSLGGESSEGAEILGFLGSFPLNGLLEICLDRDQHARQWIYFLAVAVVVNSAMLGTVLGLAAGFLQQHWHKKIPQGEVANTGQPQSPPKADQLP